MDQDSSDSLILYAPNVHQGGGLVLLTELLGSHGVMPKVAILDRRALLKLPNILSNTVFWVNDTVFSRFRAEFVLKRLAKPTDTVLCFHGLPTLFKLPGKVVVFIQNKLLVDATELSAYPLRVRLRIAAERLWLKIFLRNVTQIIVQTPTMAYELAKQNTLGLPVKILPFCRTQPMPRIEAKNTTSFRFDFVYVASGEPHKNHRALLDAWYLLAQDGYRPSLALTLDAATHSDLIQHIADFSTIHHLNVQNLGPMYHAQVQNLYQASGALIYPSITESLGLPLVEATNIGIPILAPELDYVRDVAEPAETFDAHSAVSIARAVRRFLGIPQKPETISGTRAFMREVLKKTD